MALNNNSKEDIDRILKLKEIDQLHAAILQFSKNTLATKKICATALVAVVTIILKLTNNKLDFAIYIGGAVTVLAFLAIDSSSYYYQRKLRIRMSSIVNSIRGNLIQDGFGMPINKEDIPTVLSSIFNLSQSFYFILLGVLLVVGGFDYFDYF